MNTISCIIADDEPIARQILESYIKQVPGLELAGVCKDAFEVIDILSKKEVSLLFLDINMPKLSGISLLKTMLNRPEVIITTAYPEYALEGFELSVTDYLLKPFSLERFIQAIVKVQQKQQVALPREEKQFIEKKEAAIFIKSDKKIIRLLIDDIVYIEAYGNYIKIFSDRMILSPQTLSDFLAKLPEEYFIRIHKSYIINIHKLQQIEGNQLLMNDGSALPVSKSYKKILLQKIEENS